ncbi:MAG: YbaB/EbfC family nucleoid-associated protein [Pseudomonadota bacterium]
MKNIGQMMKQAQKMQEQMTQMQERLADLRVDGAAGGGMVAATLNGKGELQALKIDPTVVDPNDVEMLEDLIVAAFNDAKTKVEEKVAEEMRAVTGGFNLPAGLNLPF